jgi:hypothetical protein
MFEHHPSVGREQRRNRRQRALRLVVRVRRIEDDEVERRGIDEPARAAFDPVADDNIAARDAQALEIVRDERRRAAIAFHERDVRGAAAQRFDPDRAGAGVPVEHARAVHARRQHVEQRLAQLVRGRPQPFPRGRLQRAPLEPAGNHAHG